MSVFPLYQMFGLHGKRVQEHQSSLESSCVEVFAYPAKQCCLSAVMRWVPGVKHASLSIDIQLLCVVQGWLINIIRVIYIVLGPVPVFCSPLKWRPCGWKLPNLLFGRWDDCVLVSLVVIALLLQQEGLGSSPVLLWEASLPERSWVLPVLSDSAFWGALVA